MGFPTRLYVRSAKPQISLCIRTVWSKALLIAWCSLSVKLLTGHHLEFLTITGGCLGSSESTLVKMPHCWNHMSRLNFSEESKQIVPCQTFCSSEVSWSGTILHMLFLPEKFGSVIQTVKCFFASGHFCRLLKPLQTVWIQIRTNRMSVMIWIQSFWHSASVPERTFWKS